MVVQLYKVVSNDAVSSDAVSLLMTSAVQEEECPTRGGRPRKIRL